MWSATRHRKHVAPSHWTTPVVEPKRFETWIYAAPLAGADVAIDGSNSRLRMDSRTRCVAQHGQAIWRAATTTLRCSAIALRHSRNMTAGENEIPHLCFGYLQKQRKNGAIQGMRVRNRRW